MARVTTGRFEFRIRPEVKERIEYAAQLVRVPVGDFVRTAAEDRADEVIRVQAATVMPSDFFDALLTALDEPPRPNAALARGARRSRKVVRSA